MQNHRARNTKSRGRRRQTPSAFPDNSLKTCCHVQIVVENPPQVTLFTAVLMACITFVPSGGGALQVQGNTEVD